jgi:hypothetical protein
LQISDFRFQNEEEDMKSEDLKACAVDSSNLKSEISILLKDFTAALNRYGSGQLPAEEKIMSKVILGLVVGGLLGIFDGLSAWFTPAVRAQLLGIVIGSTVKGLIAGVLIGYFAKKVNSLPLGIVFGLGIGLLLAFGVAAIPNPEGKHYYFEIMLPGGIVGMIVGYATQRFGTAAQMVSR